MSKSFLHSNNLLIKQKIFDLIKRKKSEEGSGKTVSLYLIALNIIVWALINRQDKPYLETTPSKLVENTKAFEWTIIKELGKLTTVTSG